MKTEHDFTRWIGEILKKVNAKVYPIVGHERQPPGLPDRYIVHRRWSGWLEMKRGQGGVRTDQRVVMKDFLTRGVTAFIVRWMGSKVLLQNVITHDISELDMPFDGKTFIDALIAYEKLTGITGKAKSANPV